MERKMSRVEIGIMGGEVGDEKVGVGYKCDLAWGWECG